jgi:hypothetical protein
MLGMCAVQLIAQSIVGTALWLRVQHIHRMSTPENVGSYPSRSLNMDIDRPDRQAAATNPE